MEVALRILSLVVYLIAGSWLASAWLVSARTHGASKSKTGRKITFVIVCWIGAIILGAIQTRISIEGFDPADFPEDRGLPADVAYDGVGNNVFALCFGWVLGLACVGIAKLFSPSRAE